VIRTSAEEYYPVPGLPLAELPAAHHPDVAERQRPVERPTRLASGVAALAYINESRWVCDCPGEGCYGALLVSPKDPRFYCPYCFNEQVGNRFIRVVFPDESTRLRIEQVLLARPDPRTRHYRPQDGETLAALQRENREHGAPIP
jgi:hypothetical protein